MNFFKQHKIQIAAILGVAVLLISLIVDTVQTVSPGIHRAKKIIESKLHAAEKDAAEIINSPELMNASADYEQ